MTKRLVVIGRGTAGAQAMAHYARWMPDCELEWHFDPSISPQAVGEGSVLSLPKNMYQNLGFSHEDLKYIDGTFKSGVAKENWGKTGEYFFHDFAPPQVSYHFNAVRLQDYIFNKLKGRVKVVEGNVQAESVDADYVMDCSGKPNNYEAFTQSEYIAVNSVHVNQCFWSHPTFQYTLAIARPYGWVFGIPLLNRCSIGYMYNNKLNTLEEIQEDMKYVFSKYGLTPSTTTNTFSFNSYKRNKNYVGRVVYNGNASFFLEPLEATSVGVMDVIQRGAYDLWTKAKSEDELNDIYHGFLGQIENFIMMHYLESPFNTTFWQFAKQRAEECFKHICKDTKFVSAYKDTRHATTLEECALIDVDYGVWWAGSFMQNISGMGLYEKLDAFTKE